MSVYIYTLPKAGTYFLAELLSNMGLNNTGRHIFKTFFQDTHRYSLKENAETPGIAKVHQYFVPVIRQMAPGDVAFGHFPLPLNPAIAPPHMKYICSYRDPKKTLVAEFVDFRFRRRDISWILPGNEPDDRRAFERYLKRHGTTVHYRSFCNIVLYRTLVNHPLADETEKKRGLFINFETALRDAKTVKRITGFLGIKMSTQEAQEIHDKTLSAETKTKAVDLRIDRDALWTDRARELFDRSGFPGAISTAREQGLHI